MMLNAEAANPGAIANGNRSIDNQLEISRSSGFGVGLRSAGQGAGGFLNGPLVRNSRETSLERHHGSSSVPTYGIEGGNNMVQRNGPTERPFAKSMGRGQSLRDL